MNESYDSDDETIGFVDWMRCTLGRLLYFVLGRLRIGCVVIGSFLGSGMDWWEQEYPWTLLLVC